MPTRASPVLPTHQSAPTGQDSHREADAIFESSRVASWRYLATGEAAIKEATGKRGEQAIAKLRETRAMVTAPAVLAMFDSLEKDLTEFKADVGQAIALLEQQDKFA